MPQRNGGPSDLDILSGRLEAMAHDSPPQDVKTLLYKLFEADQYMMHALGQIAAELATVQRDLTRLKDRWRDSRRQLDSLTGEIEDTKTFELRELKQERRKFFWLVFGGIVTAIIAGLSGAFFHSLTRK